MVALAVWWWLMLLMLSLLLLLSSLWRWQDTVCGGLKKRVSHDAMKFSYMLL